MPQKPAGEPAMLSRSLTAIIRMQLSKEGLTQLELAQKIGKSKGYVSSRLNNEAQWMVNDVEEIADALDMDAYELMYMALEERRRLATQLSERDIYWTYNDDSERSRRIQDRAASVPQQNYTWG